MSIDIAEYLPETELLAQLAEECAELAHAALKLRRAIDGTNPTPKTIDECREALDQELADVFVCVSMVMGDGPKRAGMEAMISIYEHQKLRRWRERLGARG